MAGENYIGSKISLISLSDIRYVGILHSINAQDSTVGLKQVRSFGTEGRRGKPEEEILPSDNVFDYVVFRGSDIKDLQVFEAPPKPTPPPPPSMPQDPAIMSMNAYPPPPPTAGGGGGMNHPYMNNNMYMQPPVNQAPIQQQQQQQQQPKQQPLSRPSVSSQTSNPTPPMNNNNNNNYWQPSSGPAFATERELEQAQLEKETLDELKAELEESDALQPSINEAAIEQLAKKVSELNPNGDTVISSKPLDEQQQQQSRRRYDNHHQNNYRNHRGGRFNHHKAKHDLAIPSSEFDFEASNAKFDKSDIAKKDDEHEHEEIEIPKPDEFYNKTSSFFDNISCESKERIEQQQEQHHQHHHQQQQQHQQHQHHQGDNRRSRFHEERKLNMETFGQATVEQARYRNNYNRGRGYRGNRGGGGNYYRNNNRNNYNNSNNFRQNKSQDQQETI